MIFGNPDRFAVLFELVEAWNDSDAFLNGLLYFCIGGELFPDEMLSSTLSYEIPVLQDQLVHIAVDQQVFALPKKLAFCHMYRAAFPEDWETTDNDYRYQLTPDSFGDADCHVFAVSNGEYVRVLGGGLKRDAGGEDDFENIHVSEGLVAVPEWDRMVSKLKDAYLQLVEKRREQS